MAEGKKGIIVYADWMKKFESLDDGEAGRLIKHFFRFVNDLNPVAPDRITELSFIDIEHSLKRDLAKWENKADRSRENGKLGGRPAKEEPTITQQVILEPKEPVTVNGNVTGTVINNINKTMPKADDLNDLPKKKRDAAAEIYFRNNDHRINDDDLTAFWESFKTLKLTGKKYYADYDAVYDHFANWLKTQKNTKHGSFKTNSQRKSEAVSDFIRESQQEFARAAAQ